MNTPHGAIPPASRQETRKVDAGDTPRRAQQRSSGAISEDVFQIFRLELAPLLGQIAPLAERIESLRAAGMVPGTLSGEKTFAELASVASRSAHMVERLVDLSELIGATALHDDERVLVEDLVRTCSAELTEKAQRLGIGIHLEEGRGLLAPVYGSRRWIGLALRSLLEMLADNAAPGNHISLRLRQIGAHQLIGGRIQGVKPASASQNLLTDARTRKAATAAANITTRLDLMLAQAIVKLHGGMFKTDQGDGEKLLQFTFTIPTGMPVGNPQRCHCDDCPFKSQALQYASDLADLLAVHGNRDKAIEAPAP